MPKIIKLSKTLSNQIAAWEVVERPVSVVKELVENSCDALCNNIKVIIKDGWKKYIEVEDDGIWIEKEDLWIILEKHSTSKIKTIEDLHNVMTFWFRWEALASISSVSKIEIHTKFKDSLEWYKLEYNPTDDNKKISTISKSTWTKVIVKDLFYNTPARLNYLKTSNTEYSKIYSYIQSIALSYPNIGFELINNDKISLKFNQNEDLKTRIYNIYWKEVYDKILKIQFELNWVSIEWYVSNPTIFFNNKNKQNIFVNKRPINSPIIQKAILDAYNRFIPHGSYPFYSLNLKIDPSLVDVNVHPRKNEVRFAVEQDIYRVFYHWILQILEKSNNIQDTWNEFIKKEIISSDIQKNNFYTWSGTKFKSYSPFKNTSPNPNQQIINSSIDFSKKILGYSSNTPSDTNIDKIQEENKDLHYTKLWKIIWQAFNSFILVEKDKDLYIYDQHALAERILFEKLSKNHSFSKQKLLIPENIKLQPEEFAVLQENFSEIKNIWFDFEILSWNIVSINSIPDFIRKEDINYVFVWVLNDLIQWCVKSKTLQEVKNKIIAYMACRGSIKFWNKLNLFEINKLLEDAYNIYSQTCPHWRPVAFKMSIDDISSKFNR